MLSGQVDRENHQFAGDQCQRLCDVRFAKYTQKYTTGLYINDISTLSSFHDMPTAHRLLCLQVVTAIKRENQEKVALKVVFLGNPKLGPQHVRVLRSEVVNMQQLDHVNIARVCGVIEDEVRKQLVIEEVRTVVYACNSIP